MLLSRVRVNNSRHLCIHVPTLCIKGFKQVWLVLQVLKRIEDVQMMCEKRKSSLKRLATRLPRPVHAVTPEPAIPLHHSQSQSSCPPHSHPASPLHADLPKSPKSMRKASTLPKVSTLCVTSDLRKGCNVSAEVVQV